MTSLPIESAAREVVQNDSSLNIHKGRIAAHKALMSYLENRTVNTFDVYVPDISGDDQRLDDVSMTSYNSIKNAWVALYHHWKYPDLFITVESSNGAVYTQVTKQVQRASDLSQATLW